MNKEEELKNLLKQIEEKKSHRNALIEEEKKLTKEIDKLLKNAEILTEELKKKVR